MTEMPMFPLGSVLFPHMPLQLRVFEERYLVMMGRILNSDAPEFGVVLIERGQEVGGGEKRFGVGTIALVSELSAGEGFIGLLAAGGTRFEVAEWLGDSPYPLADVRPLPDLEFDETHEPLRARAEAAVRRSLALASEFTDQQWAADVGLSDDPVASAWQLAAICPVGPLDQVSLLASRTMEELLTRVIEFATNAGDAFSLPWEQ
ncbi:MAG: LON peptidase substrate-binding domain-containing protein [Burkholderiaceae bacterium]|nr:LON peptidase substrate-binding domain-containing protein [Microbacteriaceae bacterium]